MSGEGFWRIGKSNSNEFGSGRYFEQDYAETRIDDFQHHYPGARRINFQHNFPQPQIFRTGKIQKPLRKKNNPNVLPPSKAHLVVAIKLQPSNALTGKEADQIKSDLREKIMETALASTSSGNVPYAPAFRGNPFLSAGVLKLWCENDEALAWLRKTIANMRCPRSGCKLRVVSQRTLHTQKVKASLFVPDYSGKLGPLQKLLAAQNSFYKLNSWALLKAVARQGRSGNMGVMLTLGIPVEQIPNVMQRERRVSYMAGSIYLNFITRSGLSDCPPFDWQSLQTDDKPKVETSLPNSSTNNRSLKLSNNECIVIDDSSSPTIKQEPEEDDVTVIE